MFSNIIFKNHEKNILLLDTGFHFVCVSSFQCDTIGNNYHSPDLRNNTQMHAHTFHTNVHMYMHTHPHTHRKRKNVLCVDVHIISTIIRNNQMYIYIEHVHRQT